MKEDQGIEVRHRSPQAHARRKGNGSKPWQVISESGNSHTEQIQKHSLMRRTGLHTRDFRLLDPVLSYSSSILARERAIVINLEHIKAIVTAKQVFLVNSFDSLMVQFVEDLKSRIVGSNSAPQQVMRMKEEISESGLALSEARQGSPDHNISKTEALAPKLLPFEFRVLEACLESACRSLESETGTLEEEAYPALDELTSKISTLNLERVRQIKSRLVEISGRVQKVRDELEHLLDDDNDMAEMYLTEKLSTFSIDRLSSRKQAQNVSAEKNYESGVSDSENSSEISVPLKNNNSTDELEMLLEAYFSQLESILRKLCHMNEYVGDTEDYINIMLDDKQNQLLQMSVLLNAANMFINAGIVVVGLFGMNIHISLFEAQPIKFWETTFGTVAGCVALYLIAIGWGRKRNLLT